MHFSLQQVLDQCRRRLNAVIQERNQVLDLICHAVSSVTSGRASRSNGRQSRHQDKTMSFGGNGLGYTRQIDLNMQDPTGRTSPEGDRSGARTPPTDPLGPFTPEAAQAIAQALEARQRSTVLRREIKEAIDNTQKLQQAAHEAVNDGMNKKVSETITLKVGLSKNPSFY